MWLIFFIVGGFAVVFVAQDISTEREYALKVDFRIFSIEHG